MKPARRAVLGIVTLCAALGSVPAAAALRALVILVNFPDALSNIRAEEYRRFFNDETYSGPNASMSVRRYLREVSRGRADVEFTVTDWLTLPYPVAHYVALDRGAPLVDGPIALVRDAVAALRLQGFDFRPYDSDGDGRIDLLGIVHRGSDPAFGTGTAPTWSTVPNLIPALEVDGLRLERAWMITESDPAFGTMTTLGGVLHEMAGHAMCGLPDLYGWLPGSWAPMWGGNAFRPTGFDAFSRQVCGWGRAVDIEETRTLRLSAAEEGGDAYRFWIDAYRESEYFLLEFRKQTGLGQDLPGSGLLIWHVDLSADQSNFLRLVQADGRDDLRDTSGFGAADGGDPYPGTTGNSAFTPDSIPGSRSRRGAPTGIRVENISHDSTTGTMLATVTPAAGLRGITLSYDETYPAYAWNWSPAGGNTRGERTAVRFTAPSTGRLVAVKLKYWGPPLPAAGLGFDLKVYGDFLAGASLPEPPLRSLAGNLGALTPTDHWYTIALSAPLDVRGGNSFVVDLGWDQPMIAVDYPGRSDGRSFYRAPGASTYAQMPHDLRVRAVIETGEHETASIPVFRDGVLTLPRVGVRDALIDAAAVTLRLASDGRWDLLGFVPDRYIVGNARATFAGGIVDIPRVSAPQEGASYLDVRLRWDADGRFSLDSGRRE